MLGMQNTNRSKFATRGTSRLRKPFMEGKPFVRSNRMEETQFVAEINELKRQAAQLREALSQRISQMQELQEMLDEKEEELSSVDRRLAWGLDNIERQIFELEEFVSEEHQKLEGDIRQVSKSTEQIQTLIGELKSAIETKADKTALEEYKGMLQENKAIIQALGRKNTILTAIALTNTVGIVIVIMVTLFLFLSGI